MISTNSYDSTGVLINITTFTKAIIKSEFSRHRNYSKKSTNCDDSSGMLTYRLTFSKRYYEISTFQKKSDIWQNQQMEKIQKEYWNIRVIWQMDIIGVELPFPKDILLQSLFKNNEIF
jgi:hypothetical protein